MEAFCYQPNGGMPRQVIAVDRRMPAHLKSLPHSYLKALLAILVVCALPSLTGCTDKSRAIQFGAAQFEAESLAAIEKVDEFRRKETEVKPPPSEEQSAFFVDAVLGHSGPISSDQLDILLDPEKLETPRSEAQWQALLVELRGHYKTFALTFARLNKGALLGAGSVKETVPILDKLVVQMAAIAHGIKEDPAKFYRERARIAEALEAVRDKPARTEEEKEEKREQLLGLEEELRVLVAAEEQMTRDTIEQALKAAKFGNELRPLLVDFDKLTVNDISEGVSTAFKVASDISGRDLSGLEAKTADLVGEIKKDPDLEEAFNTALLQLPSRREK